MSMMKPTKAIENTDDRNNIWDALCEVSGWDRHEAKVAIITMIHGGPEAPAYLWDMFVDLIRVDPSYLAFGGGAQ